MRRSMGLTVAAVVVTAAIGLSAASASATSLCKVNADPCGAQYPIGETVRAGLEKEMALTYKAVTALKETVFVGSCQESSMSWTTTKNEGVNLPLLGTLTLMGFGKCNSGPPSCEKVRAENLAWGVRLTTLPTMGYGFASLVDGTAVRKLKFERCGAFQLLSCTYEAGETRFNVRGGNPATSFLSFIMNTKEAGCGKEVEVSGEYSIATPNPVYVEESP